MKISVSLPAEDVEFLDRHAQQEGLDSRSAAVHKAIRLLRAGELGPAYEQAWADWTRTGDEDLWSSTTADGLG